MAGPYPMSDFQIEISTDDIAYTSYDLQAIQVTPGGGERARGVTHTAGRDVPYITHGKRSAMEWTIRLLYTDGGADLFADLRSRYLNKTTTYIRYVPEGGTSGADRFTIGPGLVESCPPPSGDAGSGDAMALEVTFVGEDEADDTVP